MAKRKPLTTVKQIQALRPRDTHYVCSIGGPATSGLYIKVLKSGRKWFFYRYRYEDEGKTVTAWERLGEYTGTNAGMDLHGATQALAEKRKLIEQHGSIPAYIEEQEKARQAELAAKATDAERDEFTVKKLVADYVDAISTPPPPDTSVESDYIKSHRKVQLSLENHIVAKIGDMPAHEVHRTDVTGALDDLIARGKFVQRNRVIAYFSRAFNWAIKNNKFAALEKAKIPVVNPCNNIERNKETPKERSLASTEIRRLLKNLPSSGIREDIADVYRLVLLMAARPGEVVRFKYSHIHDRTLKKTDGTKVKIKVLEVPDTKNKSTLVQPLSDQALEIIERRRKSKTSDYVFPSPKNPERHLREDTLNRPLRDHIGNLKVMAFTAHDLRRTAATELSSVVNEGGQKADRFMKKIILNHKDQSVTGIYDKYDHLAEKWSFLVAWGAEVDSLASAEQTELRKVG